MKNTIKECYKLIEENSSISLLKNCRKYDENLFANIFMSYQKLNNLKSFFEKISEYFVDIINNVSMQTLIRLIISRRFLLDDKEIGNKILEAQVETYIVELKQKKFTNELFSVFFLFFFKFFFKLFLSWLFWRIIKHLLKIYVQIYGKL